MKVYMRNRGDLRTRFRDRCSLKFSEVDGKVPYPWDHTACWRIRARILRLENKYELALIPHEMDVWSICYCTIIPVILACMRQEAV
jgi:hypothetical protein